MKKTIKDHLDEQNREINELLKKLENAKTSDDFFDAIEDFTKDVEIEGDDE